MRCNTVFTSGRDARLGDRRTRIDDACLGRADTNVLLDGLADSLPSSYRAGAASTSHALRIVRICAVQLRPSVHTVVDGALVAGIAASGTEKITMLPVRSRGGGFLLLMDRCAESMNPGTGRSPHVRNDVRRRCAGARGRQRH
jgi:hypothetical protein